MSLVYSCRSDDALLIPELAGWCRSGLLERCVVLLTDPRPHSPAPAAALAPVPFPEVAPTDAAAALAAVDNASCIRGRLSLGLLRAELQRMDRPRRVVVSGPAGFNGAARGLLEQCGVEADAVTILSA